MQANYELNPEVQLEGFKLPDLSDLPAEISYLFLVPKHPLKSFEVNVASPFVVTFRNQNAILRDFMNDFLKVTGYKHPQARQYFLSLISGVRLPKDMMVKDLAKKIARTKVDGIVLYVAFTRQAAQDEEYEDECCITSYMEHEEPINKENQLFINFYINFADSNQTERVYFQCDPNIHGQNLIQRVLKQFSSDFGLGKMTFDKDVKQAYYFDDDSKKKLNFSRHDRLAQQKIYNGGSAYIVLKNPNKLQLKRIKTKQYNSQIVIYKQNEIDPITLKYDDICHMTFQELYHTKLRLEQSQKKKEAIYCLKVMEYIIKPQDKMFVVEKYFINKENKKKLRIVGKVVNQKMIFYDAIPKLTEVKQNEFTLQQITIPKHQEQKRQQCRKKTKQRAGKSTYEYFKDEKNVEPILIYTAQLKYTQNNKEQVIYVSLNRYLRQNKILSLDPKRFNSEWRLKYASTLLKHLKQIKPHQGTTYRGITYNPAMTKSDIGVIFTFKQFVSTSIKRSTALSFATRNKSAPEYHMFQFKVKSGKPIIEYSWFEQGQILLQPYTQFILNDIKQETHGGKNLNIYSLQEKQTPRTLPGVKANFVIWIDDKPKEGKQIYDKITLPSETTIFQQLLSTKELQNWLDKHAAMFTDSTANVIFITNMTRKQNGVVNGIAGIQGAKAIQKCKHGEKIPIFFYIGNLKAANQKLNQSELDLTNIKVGNQIKDIQTYLAQKLKVILNGSINKTV